MHEPANEYEVQMLFAAVAGPLLGMEILAGSPRFPDVTVRRDGKVLRGELEFNSRNFAVHRHPADECDLIVCWRHDWPGAPTNIEIIALADHFSVLPSAWIASIADPEATQAGRRRSLPSWTAPRRARRGDLVVYYRTAPNKDLVDFWKVDSEVVEGVRDRDGAPGQFADLTRVTQLTAPVTLEQMRADPDLRAAGWVRRLPSRPAQVSPDEMAALLRLVDAVDPAARSALSPWDRIAPRD